MLSAYVLLFGVMLVAFSLGQQTELFAKYFGFLYTPHGQLAFLLIAGNLAWSSGLPGILAALFTNSVAIADHYGKIAQVLPWLANRDTDGRGTAGGAGGATGMMDVDRDELL